MCVSALGLKGSTNCCVCHISCGVGGKHGGLVGGVISACIVSVRKVGVTGWRVVQGCCCVDLLSQSGPCVPDFKPYLRGFRTDGLPLLQKVYIQKWREWQKKSPLCPLLWIKIATPTFMPTISLKMLNRFTCLDFCMWKHTN